MGPSRVASRFAEEAPERLYGIWWYNRRDVQRKRVLQEDAEGERRYVTRTHYADKPREEWIAVPFPDAGVSREVVDRAREILQRNEKHSSAGRRLCELSGGIFRCVESGRALVAVTVPKKRPEGQRVRIFYYRCSTRHQRGQARLLVLQVRQRRKDRDSRVGSGLLALHRP